MYKIIITLTFILSSLSCILAQHTEIQHESTFDNPHLLLTGMYGDIPSFSTSSSIRFTQKDYSEDWDLRATISDIEFVNSSFGVYFNQDPRFLYIEEESTFEISGEDNPILKLDANDTDETSINFSANGQVLLRFYIMRKKEVCN